MAIAVDCWNTSNTERKAFNTVIWLIMDFFLPYKQGDASSPAAESEDEFQFVNHQRKHSVSISMPPSPVGVHLQTPKRVIFSGETILHDGTLVPAVGGKSQNAAIFHSQPIPRGSTFEDAMRNLNAAHHPSMRRLKDKRFDSFKTWSGKLERQLTVLRGKLPRQTRPDESEVQGEGIENNIPVDRYFDALEGPELETLRVYTFLFSRIS